MGSNKFYKYHGAGNDFILIEDFSSILLSKPIASFVRSICNRSTGVGADGLLVLESSDIADVKMRIFNSDGNEASCCGNGLRSVVRHFNKPLSIETNAGISEGFPTPNAIRVSLPKSEIIELSISIPPFVGHLVDTGVPHLVIFVDELHFNGFHETAAHLRNHEKFQPDGVNVTFAKKCGDSISIRTYERGIEGETLACGTGGAAATLVHNQIFPIEQSIPIRFPSKAVTTYFMTNGIIWMEGPAELVFEGIYLPEKVNSHI